MLRKFRVKINDKEYLVEMEELGETTPTEHPPTPITPVKTPKPEIKPKPEVPIKQSAGDGEPIISPMPGTILDIKVKVGDSVSENQVVAILEAMKMENEIVAPKAGTITAVVATKGSAIDVDEVIVIIS